MPKVIDAKSWQLTPAADGRRYSKYPDGATSFTVRVTTPANGAFPAYQIYDPVGATWGAWIDGTDGGVGGVTTTVVGTPLATVLAFTNAVDAALEAVVESNAITISTQGHQLKVRRTAANVNSASRVLDFFISDVAGQRWSITAVAAAPSAERNVWLTGTFDNGDTASSTGTVDPFYIQCLAQPQNDVNFVFSTANGGVGPATSYDVRVVESYTHNGEVITPRAGSHFLASWLYYTKNYFAINNGSIDNPRMTGNLTTYNSTNGGQSLDYDTEAWLGFSVYIPSSWEMEYGRYDHRGSNMFISLSDNSRNRSLIVLSIWTLSGRTYSSWMIKGGTSDTATREGQDPNASYQVELGSIEHDLGVWTDFVIQMRSNPFTVDTNPAQLGITNAQNKLFQGNKGILRIWKSVGAARTMTLVHNVFNAPVGFVPENNYWIQMSMPRQYKYGWKNNPTTVTGPIFVGFDEIRYGLTETHGTGYADVLPGGS